MKLTFLSVFNASRTICRYLVFSLLLTGVLTSCFLLPTIPVSANPGLNVVGANILTDVSPGQTLNHKMTVSVAASDPATDLQVIVMGVTQNENGSLFLVDASQDIASYSARSFVTLDKNTLHLAPGVSQDVTATIQIPQDVGDGGRYAAIRFATKPVTGAAVNIITAINVPVYLTIKGSQIVHTGSISGLSTSDAASGKPINILANFQNTGNHHFKVKGQVTINNAKGQVLSTLPIPTTNASILPGATVQLAIPLTSTSGPLAVGSYTIDAKVTLPDGTLLDESTNLFKVTSPYTPPPQSSIPSTGTTTPNVPNSAMGAITLAPSSASTLQNGDGTVSINFPQGSVTSPVQVSLSNYSVDQVPALPSGITPASTCFRVDGLSSVLSQNATVTVKYTVADLNKAGGDASKLELARWDAVTGQWTILETVVNTNGNTLVANSNQMSIWAVVVNSPTSGMSWLIPVAIAVVVLVVTIIAILLTVMTRRQRKSV